MTGDLYGSQVGHRLDIGSMVTMIFSGRPQQVSITSPQISHRAEEYTITWETISLLRVTEYRILYRRHREREKVITNKYNSV